MTTSSFDSDEKLERSNLLREIRNTHPAEIDPLKIEDWALPYRLAKAAELQEHVCNDYCLVHRWSRTELKRRGFDPDKFDASLLTPSTVQELMRCKKGFPKKVPAKLQSIAVRQTDGIIKYEPVRDDPFINNFHPLFLHVWAANTDMQLLHPKGVVESPFLL